MLHGAKLRLTAVPAKKDAPNRALDVTIKYVR